MLESEPVIQKEINKEYRRSRFEALVIVCDRCNTTNDTLFLSMAIIDKFLAVKEVKAEDFIFLALSAVRLAWKMEEVQDEKERKEFHSNVEAIEEMENKILKVLDWRLVIPHALSFIGIFNIMEDIQYKYHVLSEYIAEVATTHFNPREYAPSMIAAASVYLARKMANLTPWTQTLAIETGIEESKVIAYAVVVNRVMKTQPLTSTKMISKDKYKADKYYNVSKLEFPNLDQTASILQDFEF